MWPPPDSGSAPKPAVAAPAFGHGAALQQLLAVRLTDAPEADALRARDAARAALDAALGAAAFGGHRPAITTHLAADARFNRARLVDPRVPAAAAPVSRRAGVSAVGAAGPGRPGGVAWRAAWSVLHRRGYRLGRFEHAQPVQVILRPAVPPHHARNLVTVPGATFRG